MFEFLKQIGKNKNLEIIIQSVEMNLSNNYKDAAQSSLKEFETTYKELEEAGKLNAKQKAYYGDKLSSFRMQMKNFTHKDQKPTWV